MKCKNTKYPIDFLVRDLAKFVGNWHKKEKVQVKKTDLAKEKKRIQFLFENSKLDGYETVKDFSDLLNWREVSGMKWYDPEALNVNRLVRRQGGVMEIDFSAPVTYKKKAFEGWTSAVTPSKKKYSTPESETFSQALTQI